jgi:hypothetical protein
LPRGGEGGHHTNGHRKKSENLLRSSKDFGESMLRR